MEELMMPQGMQNDIHYLLDNTPPNRIFLSSDWHIHAEKYGKGKNHINVSKMIAWCKEHIKENDLFLFLGDMCFRYANKEDSTDAQEIFKSLPGIKVLIIGNHDAVQGADFYTNCGFDFIYQDLIHHDIIFTHRPVNVDQYQGIHLNIHGHLHDEKMYQTTDGENNVNVYDEKPMTLDYILKHTDKLTKDNYWNWNVGYGESAISETKRSELPASAFGIPEDRKYPLDTEQHVRSAIKLFGHAEESKKKKLARRIKQRAKMYNIEIKPDSQVAKYLREASDVVYPKSTILIDKNGTLEEMDIKHIKHWHVNAERNIGELAEEDYSRTLQEAVENRTGDDAEQYYVFMCNGLRQDLDHPHKPVCLGIIKIDENGEYDWKIQYPVKLEDGEYKGIDIYSEFSLASMNPILATVKPYILKVGKNGFTNTIDTDLYAFSPDVISDKYLVINENAQLQIVDKSALDECVLKAEYEFIGDQRRVSKIAEAYYSGKTVDNTFFYTALTGKPLLTEDQIDFDKDFKKVSLESWSNKAESILASIQLEYANIVDNTNPSVSAKMPDYINGKLTRDYGLETKYNLDGYYVESTILGKRTGYYDNPSDIKALDVISMLGGGMLVTD